jgi:hypothetical protein
MLLLEKFRSKRVKNAFNLPALLPSFCVAATSINTLCTLQSVLIEVISCTAHQLVLLPIKLFVSQ